jgi:hypothetical protein
VLEFFTGSDFFGEVEHRRAGALTEPGIPCSLIQSRNGKPSGHTDDQCNVALKLPTFSATAEMAGISRVMGGYHIQSDNIAGLKMGRSVAEFVWAKMKTYFDGTAQVP